jgi:tetratricopeptide (TPR) repeat protein
MAYGKAQRHEEAVQVLIKAIEINPNYAEPYLALGNAYTALGRREEAQKFLMVFQEFNVYQKELARAVDLVRQHPHVAEAHYNLATAFTKAGHFEEAVQEYRITTDLAPNFVQAYNNLGVNHVQLGAYEEARIAYQQAIILDSTFVDAYNNLAWLHLEHGENLDRAYDLANQAVRIAPTVVSYETLATVLNARGVYRQADNAILQALRIDPDNTMLEQRWNQIKANRN